MSESAAGGPAGRPGPPVRRRVVAAWRDQVERAVDAASRAVPGAEMVCQLDPASFGNALLRLGQRLAGPTSAALSR